MPMASAISEAVFGPPFSASSTFALFCPRGARADVAVPLPAPAGLPLAADRDAGRAPPRGERAAAPDWARWPERPAGRPPPRPRPTRERAALRAGRAHHAAAR